MRRTELLARAREAGLKITEQGNQTWIARGTVSVILWPRGITRGDIEAHLANNMTVTEAAKALDLTKRNER